MIGEGDETMEKKKQLDKASVHSGKANSQGVAYNANHNTMEEARSNQPHIDQERIRLNTYLQYMGDGSTNRFKGGMGGFDARKHELQRFKDLYGEGLEARNERYRKSGHKDRCSSVSRYYRDPKTAPTEIIFQLGKKGSQVGELKRTQVMAAAWNDVLAHLRTKYGANLFPLDAALHRDEVNDHIHFRFTLGARDKFGHMVPNQSQALEAMGFDGRNPATGKKDRYHNPLVAFTDEVRETFYQACERRGIEIDREVSSGSRRQWELLTQKCQGLQKELEQHQREINESKKALDSLDYELLSASVEKDEIALAAQKAQEALKAAQDETLSLEQQITALRAAQAALEAQNKHLSDYKSKLDKRVAEVIQEGQAIVAENKSLTQTNEQLRAENRQLQVENEGLMMQLGQMHQEKGQLQAETAQAQAKRDATLEAAQELENHHRYMYEKQHIRKLREYETIPARPEKKNLRGQVIQEARPECVVVAKEDLERTKNQARFTVDTYYTRDTIKALDKKLSENEIVQSLQAQVQSQQEQIRQLSWQNSELSRQQSKNQQTIQRQKEVLQLYGLEHIAKGGPVQTISNDYPNLGDRR